MLTIGNVRRSDTKDEGDGAKEDLRDKSKHKRENKREETRHGYGEGEPTLLHSLTNSHS